MISWFSKNYEYWPMKYKELAVLTCSKSSTRRRFTAATFFGFFATGTWAWGGGGGGAIDIIGWRTTPNNFLSLSRPNTCMPILLQTRIELPTMKSTICNKYHIYKMISWIQIKDINEVKFISVTAAISVTKSPNVVRTIMRHENKYSSFSLGSLHGRAPSLEWIGTKMNQCVVEAKSCATNSGT